MTEIKDRSIEEYSDGGNVSYFLHGQKPLPKIFIDLVAGYIYHILGWNYDGETIYVRMPYQDI